MRPERLIRRIIADWPAKVLSLAVALLLTLFFNLTRLEERTISIPLSVSLNDDMAPSSSYPRMVRVSMRGEREVIYGIREDEVSASLDLSGYKTEGVYRAPVRLEKRGNALSADPLELRPEPGEIAIGLEKRAFKRVPVTPSFKGFLESGYEMTAFDLNPAEVTISGPAGLIARSSEVATDTIELSGKKSDFSVTVRLLRKDSLIGLEGQESVTFSAKVRKSLDVRNFWNLAIRVENLEPGLVLADLLPTGSVRMHITEDALQGLDQNSLLSIDLSEIRKAGSHTVVVKVNEPFGGVVETYEPQSLTLKIKEAE